MRTEIVIGAVIVGIIAVSATESAAQSSSTRYADAQAFLEHVRGADLDGLGDATQPLQKRVCLNPGLYALTVEEFEGQRGAGPRAAIADVASDGRRIADAAVFAPASSEEARLWAWNGFSVAEAGCFDLRAGGGRARIYEIRIAIPPR